MKIKKYALCCYNHNGFKMYYVKKNYKGGFKLKVDNIAMHYQREFTFTQKELKNSVFKDLTFTIEPVIIEL